MKKGHKSRSRRNQHGIALLIAIFVLLLISVVAIALLVSSGTETALGANYRSSSTVYYAALAGLEEARGRMVPKNPNYFGNTNPSLVPTPFPLGQTTYVINANAQIGEAVAPWDSGNLYFDTEYQSEFGVPASSASWQSVNSVWNNNATPGPMYKWARINAVTEKSLYMDVNQDGVYDSTTLLYYDPAHVVSGNTMPSLIVSPSPPSTAVQVLEITALAYLPNGSKKILQYLVAPTTFSLNLPAALTLDGPNVPNSGPYPFAVPWGANFFVYGTDQYFHPSSGGCTYGSNPTPNPVRAVGYSNNDSSGTTISSAIGSANHGDYVGTTAAGTGTISPNVYYVGNAPPTGPPTLPSNLQSLAGVNSLVSSLTQLADVSLTGPVTQSNSNNLMPSAMSAANPMTVVVNGDFTENGWTGAGYGILLVTGTFSYDPNSTWNGVILVIGKGIFTSNAYAQGYGQINGGVLIATTLDSSGNPLSSLGSPTFSYGGQGSQGIYYSSCWVQYVQTANKYKVLSFHEIPQS